MTSLVHDQTIEAPVTDMLGRVTAPISKAENLSPHLIPLPGGEWSLWRWMGLRGAGFPVSEVLRFGAAECAAVREKILQAEAEVQPLQQEALRILNHEAKNISAEGKAGVEKAIRQIRSNKAPASFGSASAASAIIEALRTVRSRLDSLWTEFQTSFDSALVRQSKLISEVAATNRFQEAVIWQNRQAFHTAITSLLKDSGEPITRNSRRRQHEELVAKYVQRYCAKNDTIGTFGPVGWARFIDHGPALKAIPGASLIAERNVYLEVWAIEELAQLFTKDQAFAPWLVPRRLPYVDVRNAFLFVPKRAPIKISAGQAALLQASNGDRNAREVAEELMRTWSSEFKNEADVFTILGILQKNQLISWSLEVPLELYPERTLRKWLDRIGDEELRKKSLHTLGQIEDARQRVAAAVGDPAKLNDEFSNLETVFTGLTGIAPTRGAGRTYAARTLVYEDSRRDIEVSIGPKILQAIGPALSLLLSSARWLTYQVAEMGEKYFRVAYTDLVAKGGSPVVEFTDFHEALDSIFVGAEGNVFDAELRPLLQRKWAEILAVPTGQRAVQYSSEDLRERVASVFAVPPGQRRLARYHCPDFMIAASSQEAIQRGEYQLVLGELHVAMNTLAWWLFVGQHPAPKEIEQAFDLDAPEPLISLLIPKKHWAGTSGRLVPAYIAPKDFRIEARPAVSKLDAAQILAAGKLVVEKQGNELIVRTRDSRTRFRVSEVYGEVLSHRITSSFRVITPQPYRPRISIDGLVVCREAWRFYAAELEFAFVKNEAERFVAVRRWTMSHGIPRFAFVAAPSVEVKPFYVDFDSPTYINIFSKVVRHATELGGEESRVTLSEMLPGPNEVWLPDAEDRLYTSELRVVALDH